MVLLKKLTISYNPTSIPIFYALITYSCQNDILIPTYRSTMGNESQHTLHPNEIDEVFQNGKLRYISLIIGLMYIQTSKQSEMDEVFQNGIFRYIGLMIGLMCIQSLHVESLVTKCQYLSCSMSHSGSVTF